MATYGVSLNVNGSLFTVDDSSMRPFVTQDGRTYVSIAALNKMNIANVSYDRNTKTVSINSSNVGGTINNSELQAQVNAQAAEISKLQNENNQLKAELAKKNNSSSSSNSNSNSNNSSEFSRLSNSERRSLARDIDRDLRSIRATTRFFRTQKFASSTELTSKSVVINLYQDYQLSAEDIRTWNDLASGRRASELEDEYADFLRYEIMEALKATLKGYSGYNVDVIIYSVQEPSNSVTDLKKAEMVNISYSYNRDKISSTVYNNVTMR